jgi:hypothetical protein
MIPKQSQHLHGLLGPILNKAYSSLTSHLTSHLNSYSKYKNPKWASTSASTVKQRQSDVQNTLLKSADKPALGNEFDSYEDEIKHRRKQACKSILVTWNGGRSFDPIADKLDLNPNLIESVSKIQSYYC